MCVLKLSFNCLRIQKSSREHSLLFILSESHCVPQQRRLHLLVGGGLYPEQQWDHLGLRIQHVHRLLKEMLATTYPPTRFFQTGFLQLSKWVECWQEHGNDGSRYHQKNGMVPQNPFLGGVKPTRSSPDHHCLCCFEKRFWDSPHCETGLKWKFFYWYISD